MVYCFPLARAKKSDFCYTVLIESNPTPHRASIDDSGNIVLPGEAVVEHMSRSHRHDEGVAPTPNSRAVLREESWEIVEDPQTTVVASAAVDVREHIASVSHPFKDMMVEGARQYEASFSSAVPALHELSRETHSLLRRSWHFLQQPVWVMGKKDSVKEYRRGTLFFLDVLRFGGTFAMIFAFLFLTLNYQSFWQIAAAKVEPLVESPSLDGETTGKNPVSKVVEQNPGSILAYLPDVGPPVNMIVIPKIHKVAPLVDPPTENLLAQKWNEVEQDIQNALLEGAVHYPGTARPGQAGNFFVTGHSSNYPWIQSAYNTLFARLHELAIGDEYWAYYNGDRHKYVVRSIKEVSPSDISVLDQPADERIGTLMTCTPTGTTLRRLIVVSQEVDPETGEPMKVGERSTQTSQPKLGIESLPI